MEKKKREKKNRFNLREHDYMQSSTSPSKKYSNILKNDLKKYHLGLYFTEVNTFNHFVI